MEKVQKRKGNRTMSKKEIKFIDEESPILMMTEKSLLREIKLNGVLDTIGKYNVPEDFILRHIKEIGVSDILNILKFNYVVSQEFIEKCIEDEHMEKEFIYELNMNIYSNLNDEFIKKYDDHINWNRMMTYLVSSEQIEDISSFETVIEKCDLWGFISATELSIDFIRKNKDKLDWRFVSFLNDFTDEEKQEFSSYMLESNWEGLNNKPFEIDDTGIDMESVRVSIRNAQKETLLDNASEILQNMDPEKIASVIKLINNINDIKE